MKEIWKYELEATGRVDISIPHGAKPLCVQVQNGDPFVWMLVDPDEPRYKQQFMVVGTGHPFDPKGYDYIGTWQSGAFVWHLFAKRK